MSRAPIQADRHQLATWLGLTMGLVMALAVTLLLSVVPLKTPYVELDLLNQPDLAAQAAGVSYLPARVSQELHAAHPTWSTLEAQPLQTSVRQSPFDLLGSAAPRWLSEFRSGQFLPTSRAWWTASSSALRPHLRAPPAV